MVKKLIITTLIGTLAYFAVGWLVFDVLLGSYTNAHTTQLAGFKKTGGDYTLTLLSVSCLAYAALMSFIIVYLLNLKAAGKAFFIGGVVGTLVAMMADTYWLATSNFYLNVTVVVFDVLAAAFTVGFMAFVIAFVNKKLG